ncbi:MAG: methyl-accepting chemotaxis protein [Longimicrobiales bacterium]
MTELRGYFDRIQGRLLSALLIGFAGTLATFLIATVSLDEFTNDVNARVEELQQRTDLALNFEAAVTDQLETGAQFLLSGTPSLRDQFDTLAVQARQLHARYDAMPDLTEAEQSQLERVRTLHEQLTRSIYETGGQLSAEAAAAKLSELQPSLHELRAQIRGLNAGEVRKAEQASIAFRTASADRQRLLLIVLAASVIIALFFAYRTLSAIERPLARLITAANQFGAGDLTVSVNGRMPHEFRQLATSFTSMAERFRIVVGETVATANRITASASDLSSVSEEVAASSGEVSTAMIDITNGAEEQALGLRSVDEALRVMRTRAVEIDSASSQVRTVSGHIGDLASTKRRDIGRAIAMLREVRQIVQDSGQEVAELQRASARITAFVETIQGIARQTNLLALNAAIEAARAGEHGRGFAVVADEVRKLADGSSRAADEIDVAVRQIRRQIENAASTMDRGVTQVSGVEDVSRSAETAFEEILEAVESVRSAATSVDSAAEENRNAVFSVEENVRAVGATAESHAASAQEVSAAAEEQSAATEELSAASVELLHAAERLKELVSGFRTG